MSQYHIQYTIQYILSTFIGNYHCFLCEICKWAILKIKPGGTHCLKISIFPRAPDFRTIYHCIRQYQILSIISTIAVSIQYYKHLIIRMLHVHIQQTVAIHLYRTRQIHLIKSLTIATHGETSWQFIVVRQLIIDPGREVKQHQYQYICVYRSNSFLCPIPISNRYLNTTDIDQQY